MPPTLSRSIAAIRHGVFAELQGRIDALSARGGDLVPLQIGDTTVAPPDEALLSRAVGDESTIDPALYRYGATTGLAALRHALAERARSRFGLVDVDGDHNVLIGSGATHAIHCAARAILDPGDDVLLASPYWPLAHGILNAASARTIEVPLTSRLYDDPTLDAGELFAAAITERTRAIYLITPNNPDGKVLSRAQLSSIARLAVERDLWVFSDEAYADHAFDAPHVSIATLPGMAERTVAAYSLSKSHALAGLRIGCIVAPAPLIVAARKVAVHTTFNVPVVTQRAALAALTAGGGFVEAARDRHRQARDVAISALEGSGIAFGRAEGGTYLFLDLRDALGGRPLKTLLERAIDRGVLLAPGEAFGSGFEGFARLCYSAVSNERLASGITRLRAAISDL